MALFLTSSAGPFHSTPPSVPGHICVPSVVGRLPVLSQTGGHRCAELHLARIAVERVDISVLASYRDSALAARPRKEHGRGSDIVVPRVVLRELVTPLHSAGPGVEHHH